MGREGDQSGSPRLNERAGKKKKKRAEWKGPSKGEAMFPPQKHDSLLVLLTSFPHRLGKAVFELLEFVGIRLLEVLGAKLSPFARPSPP